MWRDIVFQVWNSTVFICADAASAFAVFTSISGSWPSHSDAGSSLMPSMGTLPRCFWKNSSPPTPSGPRTSDTGRPFRCGSRCGAMAS